MGTLPRRTDPSGRLVVGLALCLLWITYAVPVKAGGEAFASRTLAPDPGWQATVGAFGTTGDSPASLTANPAAAAAQLRPQVALSHLVWAGDLSREWAALAAPVTGRIGLGADLGFVHGPALAGYDASGNPTGTFAPTEWDAGLTVGFSVGHGISLGAGARYFRLEDPIAALSGFGASAGLRWEGAGRTVGLSVTDFGPETTGEESYTLPTRYRLGLEQGLSDLARLALTVESGDGRTAILFGGELMPRDWFSLLSGLRSESGSLGAEFGWATGFAVQRSGLRVSYAFVLREELGELHQIGIALPLRNRPGPWLGNRESEGRETPTAG